MECRFELSADLLIGIIDDEECNDLLKSECNGLDAGLFDLDTCRYRFLKSLDHSIEIDLCAFGHEVIC